MASPLGVGFIGAGSATQAIHLPTLARLGNLFRVVHLSGGTSNGADLVAARLGNRASRSVDQLLADPEVDVVAVCSPHERHADHVIAACRSGKRAVLCEKPLALTTADADRISAVAAETGVPVLVGAMHSFDPAWLAARQLWDDQTDQVHAIRSSIVGPPNSVFEDSASELTRTPHRGFLSDDLASRRAGVSTGLLVLGIHLLPHIRTFVPHSTDRAVTRAKPQAPIGYDVSLRIGEQLIDLYARLGHNTWQPRWRLEVLAGQQVLTIDFPPPYVHAGSAVATLRRGHETRVLGPYPYNGYENEWLQLHAVASGTREPPPMQTLVDDLGFAIDVARSASAAVGPLPEPQPSPTPQPRPVTPSPSQQAGTEIAPPLRVASATRAPASSAAVQASLPLSFRPTGVDEPDVLLVDGNRTDWPDVVASSDSRGILLVSPTVHATDSKRLLALRPDVVLVVDTPWAGAAAAPEIFTALPQSSERHLDIRATDAPTADLEQILFDLVSGLRSLVGPVERLEVLARTPFGIRAQAEIGAMRATLSCDLTAARPRTLTVHACHPEGHVEATLTDPETAQPATLEVVSGTGLSRPPTRWESAHRTAWRHLRQLLTTEAVTPEVAPNLLHDLQLVRSSLFQLRRGQQSG